MLTEYKTEITVTTTTTFSIKEIEDIICAAFEGGINYWCDNIDVPDFGEHTYAHEVLAHGGKVILNDFEDDDKKHEIDGANIQKGLELMAKGLPNAFARLKGDYDALDADGLIQYAVFGNVIYG